MKREGTIGAATFLAIVAMVGFSVQTGPKQAESGRASGITATKRSKPSTTRGVALEYMPGCGSLRDELQEFLDIDGLMLPAQCYETGGPGRSQPQDLTDKTSHLKFVVVLLPDPVHTHLSVLFDQFAVAIQEGAQDEKYDFDSSWMPWDDEQSSYPLLADEKASNREKELKEDQPGIILFRRTPCLQDTGERQKDCQKDLGALAPKGRGTLSRSYREGLVVFVIGEEATHGIHREQFRNAMEWIATLQPKPDSSVKRLGILGPTFSGSLPSLEELLSERKITEQLDLRETHRGPPLAIYSGSVSSSDSAKVFQDTFDSQVVFHSFVESDDEILRRFCNYITKEQPGFDAAKIAIISEDETAYGGSGVESGKDRNDEDDTTVCTNKALNLYYPRDISALRGAYQTKSLFDTGGPPQPADVQRKNLPTDLADPTGKVHDSIRSYGGNQTPLTQEAFLLEIVAALRELHARYVFLRSSNTLDQLFLTNFLRRSYPDARIVIFGSDLMFIRERGATGLSGAMALSTYPLFPLERDWTEHQSLTAADRAFSTDTAEGTYVALRLLLNHGEPDLDRCHVLETPQVDETKIFLPHITCATDPPIPDYSPPFWTLSDQCGEVKHQNPADTVNANRACTYRGPATWLSVIGSNRFWPMASLTELTPAPPLKSLDVDPGNVRGTSRKEEPGGRPEMPVGMKVFLLLLAGFALFHAWCCWSGSYTAQPAFLAHFASTRELRHTSLVWSASCCVAFLALVAGWGCGVFRRPDAGLAYPWFAFCSVTFVCLMAWLAILANVRTSRELSKDISSSSTPDLPRMTDQEFASWIYRASGLFIVAIALFCLLFVVPIEGAMLMENRVLTYWRAMHLASGVSPLVPIFSILTGLYLSCWFALHGLALFGPDRPRLPLKQDLALKDAEGKEKEFLRMFSQEDAAASIEKAAMPLTWKMVAASSSLFVLFLVVALGIAGRSPVRSLGAESYAIIFVLGLDVCGSLAIVEVWRLYQVWGELRRLLTFLDRLPLRRTMAMLHGFSWGSVWKMSGNVLEVRYKVISRQMECMNHSIAVLEEFLKNSSDPGVHNALDALLNMRGAGLKFADWYSTNYANLRVGDLSSFTDFQKSIAFASGTLFAKLLVPAWRREKESLLVVPGKEEKDEATANPLQAKDAHIRNAEEFVCLNYLGFIQNVLGRLRTIAMTIVVLFLACTVAASTYPFDPQQALSAVLIALFVLVGIVIVKVYADMHRDATLSHVTNTKPGELGTEFWFKMIGFGLAPLIGLLTRVFPGMTDFVFSWLQPGLSSLK
jgi:hypothetical protein